MKLIKRISATLISLLLVGLIAFNLSLFYKPKFIKHGNQQINKDLLAQLQHLKTELHSGAADDMQRQYPEGFVFMNALYALSWAELAACLPPQDTLYKEAHCEIDWALKEMTSEKGRRPFQEDLNPAYGIFYSGWTNYVLGRKLRITPVDQRDSLVVKRFRQNCEDIIAAFEASPSPFLESYSRACWPADMTVAMASIAIHNELFPGSYTSAIIDWLEKVESKTDTLGLIPHASNWITGQVRQPARGSSQSLILNFLWEIDSAYAKQKFVIYKKAFQGYRLGLPALREYPKGTDGQGDIDSGPVIWGMGGAASIVGQRVMALYGEPNIAIGIRNSIESFGLGRTKASKKEYLFGELPMADAFIAWSNSVEACRENRLKAKGYWQWRVQLGSLLLLVLGGWGVVRLWRR